MCSTPIMNEGEKLGFMNSPKYKNMYHKLVTLAVGYQ